MFERIKEYFFGKKTIGLWLSVGTDKGTILKVSLNDSIVELTKGNAAIIYIHDFVVNKKSQPLIEKIKTQNLIWTEVPGHFKKKLKNNSYARVDWGQIEGYLI